MENSRKKVEESIKALRERIVKLRYDDVIDEDDIEYYAGEFRMGASLYEVYEELDNKVRHRVGEFLEGLASERSEQECFKKEALHILYLC